MLGVLGVFVVQYRIRGPEHRLTESRIRALIDSWVFRQDVEEPTPAHLTTN